MKIPILFLFLFFSCSSDTSLSDPVIPATKIHGRNKELIYQVKAPPHFQKLEPVDDLLDTRTALCEFFIREGDVTIRITIHNFPHESKILGIPPQAQVNRWIQQFEQLPPSSYQVIPVAHGGFSGLYFEGGDLQKFVLGWAMQMSEEHARNVSYSSLYTEKMKEEICAEYTIKATGPPLFMQKHKESIIAFANSFELIEELPEPL